MARKTAGDKSDKGSASADKHAGEKTPIDPPKNTQEPEHLGKNLLYFWTFLDIFNDFTLKILFFPTKIVVFLFIIEWRKDFE